MPLHAHYDGLFGVVRLCGLASENLDAARFSSQIYDFETDDPNGAFPLASDHAKTLTKTHAGARVKRCRTIFSAVR